MYKTRINDWNIHKNLKMVQKAEMVETAKHMGAQYQPLHHNRPVQHRLTRFCRENQSAQRQPGAGRKPARGRRLDRGRSTAMTLQSLPGAAAQNPRLISPRGDARGIEEIVWNAGVYLDSYFTIGPGTRYYKASPSLATPCAQPQQSRALVRDEQAWRDVTEPYDLYNSLLDVIFLLRRGFVDPAFATAAKLNDLVQTVLQQQSPDLMTCIFSLFTEQRIVNLNIGKKFQLFVTNMAAIVLGKTHPITNVLRKLCTLESATQRCRVWCAVTDASVESFERLETPDVIRDMRMRYCFGLEDQGLVRQAEVVLDKIFAASGEMDRYTLEFTRQKARLLKKQEKYLEAEAELVNAVQMLQVHEQDILTHGKQSTSRYWRFNIDHLLFDLAVLLRQRNRAEEAKTMFWRVMEFDIASFGADHRETVLTGSNFEDFLMDEGFEDDRETLRAKCPELRGRKIIPEAFRSDQSPNERIHVPRMDEDDM